MEVEKMSNLAFLLVLALCMSQPLITNASWFSKRYVIHIENRLSNYTLQAHCRSGDQDLGLHRISKGKQFQWEFYISFWSIKVYFCNLSWLGGQLTFDAFSTPGCEDWALTRKSDLNCNWRVQDNGIYMFDFETREYEFWKYWETFEGFSQ